MKNRKKSNSSLLWIWKVSGKKKINIVFLLFVQIALAVSSVGLAWILRGLIDKAAAGDKGGFYQYAVMLVSVVACQILLRAVNRFLEEFTRSTMENRFKERLFSSLLTRDYARVTAVHSGEWMNRLTSDTIVVSDGLTLILPGVIGMLVKMIGALALILVLIPKFAFILIPGGLVLILVTYGFRKVLKRLHKEIQEADGKLRVFFQERLGSLMIVRCFAREEQTIREANVKMQHHKKIRMKRNHFSNVCNIGFASIMRGGYVLGAIYCAYGILQGTMTYGTFTAVLQLISQIQSPFANITGYLPRYYSMLASAERLMEVENCQEDCREGALSREESHRFYCEEFESVGLEQAAFTYFPPVSREENRTKENMPVVIKNVDLEIHRGEYIAFTGQSGCGKSTILKLLMCLYPLDGGACYLGKKDGGRLPLVSKYRSLFAYVPQGNQLMSGTIREVVAFSDVRKMKDEEGIWRSLTIACADEYIRELKDGIDTQLGERGMGLSEGQMQRIAIARAICSDNPILMLDESTSALDETTEKRLLHNLQSMTDKTVLIVTHRPAVLEICDRQIIMTENGMNIIKREEVKDDG